MLILTEFLFAATIAIVFSSLLVGVFGRRRPGYTGAGIALAILFFFLVIGLTAWALGTLLTPFGPPLLNAYWAPILVVAIILSLLILLVAPTRETRMEQRDPEAKADEAGRAHEQRRDAPSLDSIAERPDMAQFRAGEWSALGLNAAFWALALLMVGILIANYADLF